MSLEISNNLLKYSFNLNIIKVFKIKLKYSMINKF